MDIRPVISHKLTFCQYCNSHHTTATLIYYLAATNKQTHDFLKHYGKETNDDRGKNVIKR